MTNRPDPEVEARAGRRRVKVVTESDLLRAGRMLRSASVYGPDRWAVSQVAEWLAGYHGPQGSPWPIRKPLAPEAEEVTIHPRIRIMTKGEQVAVCLDVLSPMPTWSFHFSNESEVSWAFDEDFDREGWVELIVVQP